MQTSLRVSPSAADSARDHAGRNPLRIAVVIPCRNEVATIAEVIRDFQRSLPSAAIWICDNLSTDGTAARAAAAGAIVIDEPRPGKGNAIRRLFACADADVYVMADGDGTYPAARAPDFVRELVERRLEMVVARRVTPPQRAGAAYRRGHAAGNRAFAWVISRIFGVAVTDPFSGYRVFSDRFVRSFPAISSGFEIETELTIHALELGMTVREVPAAYVERPQGSTSKLRTFRDGARIALTLLHLYEQVKPFAFFSIIASLLAAASLALGVPVVVEYIKTGLVPRFPTAILASAIMLLAFLAAVCGAILDSVARSRREIKRLAFLSRSGSATTGIDAAN